MRVRHGIIALALAASLAACGGDDTSDASGDPSSNAPATSAAADPTTAAASGGDSVNCAGFKEAQLKAAALQGEVASGTDVSASLDAALKSFDELKIDAPGEIQTALDEVQSAFRELSAAYKDMDSVDPTKLQETAQRLQKNALILNNYITENCTQ